MSDLHPFLRCSQSGRWPVTDIEPFLMFLPEADIRIWLCTQPTDMRKSFNGLSVLVKSQLEEDPLSGQLFAFINKRKTQMKVLYFDRTGYCIWAKRLEQGQFNFQSNSEGKKLLSWMQLKLLLEGIKIEKQRQYKRYDHKR
ncbi:MAG: IS66 family insertion sequence element accessory protein TnpB [Thiomicrorhabdus sp.]|nr:IS66 family insertion sequence element accessory protein TnpB [Thiomicrorhabdus sp.]